MSLTKKHRGSGLCGKFFSVVLGLITGRFIHNGLIKLFKALCLEILTCSRAFQ